MEQLTLDPGNRRFRIEGHALCARLGPLPFDAALSGIAQQSTLDAPAKFSISRSGEIFVGFCGHREIIRDEILPGTIHCRQLFGISFGKNDVQVDQIEIREERTGTSGTASPLRPSLEDPSLGFVDVHLVVR